MISFALTSEPELRSSTAEGVIPAVPSPHKCAVASRPRNAGFSRQRPTVTIAHGAKNPIDNPKKL